MHIINTNLHMHVDKRKWKQVHIKWFFLDENLLLDSMYLMKINGIYLF